MGLGSDCGLTSREYMNISDLGFIFPFGHIGTTIGSRCIGLLKST